MTGSNFRQSATCLKWFIQWDIAATSRNLFHISKERAHAHAWYCVQCNILNWINVICGHAVAHLVKTLRYMLRGHKFDSWSCHWNFWWIYSFRPHYVPWVDAVYNGNEYQEYFLGGKRGRCIRLTTKLPSRADRPLIWDPQPSGTLWASNSSVQGSLCLFVMYCICLTASDHMFSFWIMIVFWRTAMHDTQEISTKRTRTAWQMFCYVSFNVCRKDKRKEPCCCTSQEGIQE